MALNATHEAFGGFAVDGKPKKIAQTANLWALMRGSAADTDTPSVTLDFDFVWQVSNRPVDNCADHKSVRFMKHLKLALAQQSNESHAIAWLLCSPV
jgi:hypothetical protein